ncbi:sensor histidine kinase [Propionibacteriaceae bacterium G1746]|uniref:sensor histidine kinase n=1 Tax=Aestuariimicrobium sp. G57 TaxID=3418485 RepID=UPI003C247F9E
MKGPLTRRLTWQVALVVALVAAAVAAVAWLAMRNTVMNQVDTSLHQAATRQLRPGPGDQDPAGANELGNPIGTIFVEQVPGVLRVGMVAEGELKVPSTEAIQTLLDQPRDGQPHTVELAGLGDYRVLAQTVTSQDGRFEIVKITGLPLGQTDQLLARVALVEVALVLAAVVIAVIATRLVVTRALRPLYRVAATAHEVSQLELDRGEVVVPNRVSDSDADPSSEVGQVGQALNHLLGNVEGALAVRQQSETKLRRFVADASHELRNPLAAIRGYAELTRRDRDTLPQATAHALSRIDAESARMGLLVEDLLLLARLDADPQLTIGPVDVVELVLQATSDARAAGPDHDWHLALPDEPVAVSGDAHRITQMVTNLLGNARTHTPAGTRVTVSVARDGDRVLVRVHDNGPGVDPAIIDQVFERFARADTARAHTDEPSTGLGLAIVAALAQAMGGRASVQSTPGDTTFTLDFAAASAVFPGA